MKLIRLTCAELLDDVCCCSEPIPLFDELPIAPFSAFDADDDTGCGRRGNRSNCCRAACRRKKTISIPELSFDLNQMVLTETCCRSN